MTPKISQIIRSSRKTFSLEVKPDGQLIVRAPKTADDDLIKTMVAKKGDWIAKTQSRLARQYPEVAPPSFTPGEQFWYLGNKYPLKFTDRQRPLLELDGAFYLFSEAQDRAKEIFTEWYREETRK
ncbi:MAG TPA: YgjP-like metallopeptidase domain-containing protein, partial [Brevefilum sp.]